MTEINVTPITETLEKYTFRQSNQLKQQTGCIGYLRADFGSSGKEFYSTWNDICTFFKTDEFKKEFDDVINALRFDEEYGRLLNDRLRLGQYCHSKAKQYSGADNQYYGIRVDTARHTYLEELDEDNISVIFKNALTASVGYMMMTRCGINADEYYDREDFRELFNFNEFDKKVRENPSNNHLRTEVLPPAEKNEPEETADNFLEQYNEIKSQNADSLLLYQVGDFFECYGEDAKTVAQALDLHLTERTVAGSMKADMCGFPKHRLETYLNMLNDRGFDVAVFSVENGERKTVTVVSTQKEDPVNSFPVGRIDYLHTDGTVRESIEYTSEYQFVKDIKDENYYGVPMEIYVYADKDGKTIFTDFVTELDPPPQSFDVIPSPYLERAEEEKTEELTDADLIGKEVMIDGDRFIIEKVDPVFGDVSMRDTSSAYPINRVEKIGFVREHLNRAPQEFTTEKVAEYPAGENGLPYDIVVETIRTEEPELTPSWEEKKETVTTLQPTVPDSQKHKKPLMKKPIKQTMCLLNSMQPIRFQKP